MGPEAVWCCQHNTCMRQVSLCFIGQSAECVGRSGGVPDRQTVCAWISRTLRRDGGHSVSARVGQDYPKSMRCLDGRSGGDVRRSAKTGSARFWVGVGKSDSNCDYDMHTRMIRNDCLHCNGFRVVTQPLVIFNIYLVKLGTV